MKVSQMFKKVDPEITSITVCEDLCEGNGSAFGFSRNESGEWFLRCKEEYRDEMTAYVMQLTVKTKETEIRVGNNGGKWLWITAYQRY